jgi:hypothetical protein
MSTKKPGQLSIELIMFRLQKIIVMLYFRAIYKLAGALH